METKPQIKIGFVDYFKGIDELFMHWLSAQYDVIRDDVNPDFLFFCDETFGQQNLTYDMNKVVKIFYTGENRRPWNYATHFAITFDHHDTATHYRLPLYVVDHFIMTNKLGMDTVWNREFDRMDGPTPEKTEFCCFISGNPGNQHRNEFFHKLSKYKKVDAYGPLFNNTGYVLPRGDEAAKNKDGVLKKYKFNLCFENGQWPGYCTEKLFHALYSHTVPIYAGSPTAALDFNPKAFLNWHDTMSDDDLIEHIRVIDESPLLMNKMLQEHMIADQKWWDSARFLRWFDQNVYNRKPHTT